MEYSEWMCSLFRFACKFTKKHWADHIDRTKCGVYRPNRGDESLGIAFASTV